MFILKKIVHTIFTCKKKKSVIAISALNNRHKVDNDLCFGDTFISNVILSDYHSAVISEPKNFK